MKFYLECITEYMDDPVWWFFSHMLQIRATWEERLQSVSKPRLRSHLKHQWGSFRLGGGWERGRGREDLVGP